MSVHLYSQNKNTHSVQTNRFTIMQLSTSTNNQSLKVKLRQFLETVASAASNNSRGINHCGLHQNEFMCIFYLPDQHHPSYGSSSNQYSVHIRNSNLHCSIKPSVQHHILSFKQLFQNFNLPHDFPSQLAISNRTR